MFRNILYLFFIFSLCFASVRFFHLDQKAWHLIQKWKQEIIKKTENPQKNKSTNLESTTSEIETAVDFSSSEHLSRGKSYYEQGFIELARDEYLAALKKEPNQKTYLLLAQCQTLLKNYEGAIQNLKTAINLKYSPSIQIAIAKNFMHLFDFTSAKKILKHLKGKNKQADYWLNVFYLMAQHNLEEIPAIANSDNFLPAQNLQKAINTFQSFSDGQNIYFKALLAQVLVDNKDFELAIYLTEKILKERSDYRDVWIINGYAYLSLENYEKAKNALENAYDLDPVKPQTQYFLAVVLEELEQKETALEFYQLAYKNKYEPKIHVLQKIAELSLNLEYYDEAYTLYEEILKLENTEIDSFIRPVWIAIDKLNNLEKAEAIALWAQKLFPEEAQSYNLLAWVEIEKGNISRAQNFLNQALQFNKTLAAAHLNQGRIDVLQNNLEQALKSFEKAYSYDKDGSIGNLAAKKYNELLLLTN